MKKIFSEVRRLTEFEKDLKRLSKKYRTLEDDLETFINTQLNLLHKQGQDNGGCVRIANLGITYPYIYKARKFACKSLKGTGSRSGIRVIYAYFEKEDVIEFVEIYYKGDKPNEDKGRILQIYKKSNNTT
jgi:mRNA-degrading endonuclease RelE of RelBE toxin-antitoxin system